MDSSQSSQIDNVFSALAHPVRRQILNSVCEQEKTVVKLAAPYDISLNAVSKHIKKLESAGLVKRSQVGSHHQISMDTESIQFALQWMSRYAPFWQQNLHGLKTSLKSK
jgi:DNA-binding transcriptional ArsR family regulator